jgi:hypothetical protein
MLTMLSPLQHVNQPDLGPDAPEYLISAQIPSDGHRQELKVLSALATVLVEKVAVVAKV